MADRIGNLCQIQCQKMQWWGALNAKHAFKNFLPAVALRRRALKNFARDRAQMSHAQKPNDV